VASIDAILDEAIHAFNAGDHYEAHERLEDLVDALDDANADDRDREVALALVHVAASFHKLVHDVGRRAVPGKLGAAVAVLERAPPVWMRVDLGAFLRDLSAVRPAIERLEVPSSLPMLTRRMN
jgi:hypothetical protein